VTELVRKRKCTVANGGVYMQFKKSLRPFQRYQIRSRLFYWDEKWLYVQHKFMVGKEVYAVGVGKAVVKDNHKTIQPSDALKLCGWGQLKPMILDPKAGLSRSLKEIEGILNQ